MDARPWAVARELPAAQDVTSPFWFYFDSAGDLIAVPTRTAPSLEFGTPLPLFKAQMRPDIDTTYVVTKDGQRFLLNLPNPNSAPMNVVVNWLADRGGSR